MKFIVISHNNIIYDTILLMTNKELIQTIKARKEILAVNQEYLAELSGVGIATLKRLESGKGNITLKNLHKIADVLGLEVILELKKTGK